LGSVILIAPNKRDHDPEKFKIDKQCGSGRGGNKVILGRLKVVYF